MVTGMTDTTGTAGALPHPPALGSTLGALLLGTLVATVLLGIFLHQVILYYRQYPRDPRSLKYMVLSIFLLETAHTVCIFHTCYWYLITNYTDLNDLRSYPVSLKLIFPITALAILICQCFYLRRVYRFGSCYRIFVAASAIFLVASKAIVMVPLVDAIRASSTRDIQRVTWLVSVSYGLAVVSDDIMTGTLMYALLRNRTGFKRTDSTIATLAMYAINTGVVTGIVNILVFVFGLIQPDNYVWVGLAMTSSRLYANAVMAMLNSRKSLITAMFEDCVDTETVGAQLGLPRNSPPVTTTSLEPGCVVPVTLHITPGGQYDARRGPSLQRVGSIDSSISRSISPTKIEHGPKLIAPDRSV